MIPVSHGKVYMHEMNTEEVYNTLRCNAYRYMYILYRQYDLASLTTFWVSGNLISKLEEIK